jgi:hypothetical protein
VSIHLSQFSRGVVDREPPCFAACITSAQDEQIPSTRHSPAGTTLPES